MVLLVSPAPAPLTRDSDDSGLGKRSDPGLVTCHWEVWTVDACDMHRVGNDALLMVEMHLCRFSRSI